MQGTSLAYLVFAIVLLALVVAPILAISAVVRVRRVEKRQGPEQQKEPQLNRQVEQQFQQQLANLTARLYAIETRLSELTSRPREAPAAPVADPAVTPPLTPPIEQKATSPAIPPTLPAPRPSAAVAPPSQHVPAPLPKSPQVRTTFAGGSAAPDFESVVAGRWLNYAGVLAVLCAVAFFLKYAFDNNWVGPHGRIAIGLLFGAGLLMWSDRLLRKGYRYFSEGIAGLGAAVLYLSLWGGWHYYRLFEQSVAFAAMIVVTVAMIAIAVGRNSQRIAVMALLGGFLTPQLLSTGKNAEITLFTYVLVLVFGLLILQRVRKWEWLAPLAFVGTQIYFWGWFGEFYRVDELGITLLFATLFFIAFAALPVVRSREAGGLSPEKVVIVPANALIYLIALHQMLWPGYRWTITFAVLALAAAHLVVLRALPVPREKEPPTAQFLFAGLALMYATLAIPLRLDGKWITVALAIEGAILIWSGFRTRLWYLRAFGLLLFGVTAFRLLLFDIPATTFIFNARFATFAIAVACYSAACLFASRAGDKTQLTLSRESFHQSPEAPASGSARNENFAELRESEIIPFAVLAVAANGFALLALSLEVWDALGRTQTINLERDLAQSLGLSILWTCYATGLIVVGLARKSALLRWQALALFGVVVAKVFLFDLSFLERFYRILSFLVLGLLLLLVSFLYQRKLVQQKQETKS
jgi:uncharacterized membrane protein